MQEIDHYAPVRGARIVVTNDLGPRADMTASWLTQLGWKGLVFDWLDTVALETGAYGAPPQRDAAGRYKRPYEGTDNPATAMQAYLDREFELNDLLPRDGTHGFVVI